MKKYNVTKKFLIREYSKKEKSITQVAKEVGYNYETIRNKLIKYNILIRTKGKNKGKKNGLYNPEKHKKHYCIELNCNNEISWSNWRIGQRRCNSCANKVKWQNEEYRNKTSKAMLKGLKLKPNKPEKLLNKLLQKLLPNEYKFVGDGKVILGSFCPDFIDISGQKKIIELSRLCQ